MSTTRDRKSYIIDGQTEERIPDLNLWDNCPRILFSRDNYFSWDLEQQRAPQDMTSNAVEYMLDNEVWSESEARLWSIVPFLSSPLCTLVKASTRIRNSHMRFFNNQNSTVLFRKKNFWFFRNNSNDCEDDPSWRDFRDEGWLAWTLCHLAWIRLQNVPNF